MCMKTKRMEEVGEARLRRPPRRPGGERVAAVAWIAGVRVGPWERNAQRLRGVGTPKGHVESLFSQLKGLKVRQEDLSGQRKALTQSMTRVPADGRGAARKLRDFVRVHLGARNEQLTQF